MIVKNYSPKCLLAFLNSKASEWYLSKITGNLGDNAKIGQKSNFMKLVVAFLPYNKQTFFEEKVEQILLSPEHSERIEADIDTAIYKIYGLSSEEIQFIDSQ